MRLTLFFLSTFTILLGHAQVDQFFRIEKIEGTWKVFDSNNESFYFAGINHYGNGTHMPWNLKEAYGSTGTWRESVRDNHKELGFTYLPPSIGPSAINPSLIGDRPRNRQNLITRTPEWTAEQFADLDFPFTLFLEVPLQYMAGKGMPDVFGEDFISAVDARCKEVVYPLRENKQLIGYHFSHNPPWNINARSAEDWIRACTQPNSAGLREWTKLMKQIYGTVERWRETYGSPIVNWSDIESLKDPLRGYISGDRLRKDKEAFLKRICEQWYKTYHNTIRKYDENHLILGDRNTLHLQDSPAPWAYYIMDKYIDVLSVNVMGPPNTVYDVLEGATRNWDGPILLADTGAGIYQEPPKSTYQAADMDEYEEVYSGLVRMSLEHPQIIGFGWCGYYETYHPGGRSGLFNVKDDSPLDDRVSVIKKWNAKLNNAKK